jgi:hypothetical protein
MMATDADRSLLGEVTMFKMRFPLPFSYLGSVDDAREPRTRALQRSEVFQAHHLRGVAQTRRSQPYLDDPPRRD